MTEGKGEKKKRLYLDISFTYVGMAQFTLVTLFVFVQRYLKRRRKL